MDRFGPRRGPTPMDALVADVLRRGMPRPAAPPMPPRPVPPPIPMRQVGPAPRPTVVALPRVGSGPPAAPPAPMPPSNLPIPPLGQGPAPIPVGKVPTPGPPNRWDNLGMAIQQSPIVQNPVTQGAEAAKDALLQAGPVQGAAAALGGFFGGVDKANDAGVRQPLAEDAYYIATAPIGNEDASAKATAKQIGRDWANSKGVYFGPTVADKINTWAVWNEMNQPGRLKNMWENGIRTPDGQVLYGDEAIWEAFNQEDERLAGRFVNETATDMTNALGPVKAGGQAVAKAGTKAMVREVADAAAREGVTLGAGTLDNVAARGARAIPAGLPVDQGVVRGSQAMRLAGTGVERAAGVLEPVLDLGLPLVGRGIARSARGIDNAVDGRLGRAANRVADPLRELFQPSAEQEVRDVMGGLGRGRQIIDEANAAAEFADGGVSPAGMTPADDGLPSIQTPRRGQVATEEEALRYNATAGPGDGVYVNRGGRWVYSATQLNEADAAVRAEERQAARQAREEASAATRAAREAEAEARRTQRAADLDRARILRNEADALEREARRVERLAADAERRTARASFEDQRREERIQRRAEETNARREALVAENEAFAQQAADGGLRDVTSIAGGLGVPRRRAQEILALVRLRERNAALADPVAADAGELAAAPAPEAPAAPVTPAAPGAAPEDYYTPVGTTEAPIMGDRLDLRGGTDPETRGRRAADAEYWQGPTVRNLLTEAGDESKSRRVYNTARYYIDAADDPAFEQSVQQMAETLAQRKARVLDPYETGRTLGQVLREFSVPAEFADAPVTRKMQGDILALLDAEFEAGLRAAYPGEAPFAIGSVPDGKWVPPSQQKGMTTEQAIFEMVFGNRNAGKQRIMARLNKKRSDAAAALERGDYDLADEEGAHAAVLEIIHRSADRFRQGVDAERYAGQRITPEGNAARAQAAREGRADLAPAESEAVLMPLSELNLDETRFQPGTRRTIQGNFVTDIARTWDEATFGRSDPIQVWQDPANGRFYVISGQHRTAALKQRAARGMESPNRDVRVIVRDDLPDERSARLAAMRSNVRKEETQIQRAEGMAARFQVRLEELGLEEGSMSAQEYGQVLSDIAQANDSEDLLALSRLPNVIKMTFEAETPGKAVERELAKLGKIIGDQQGVARGGPVVSRADVEAAWNRFSAGTGRTMLTADQIRMIREGFEDFNLAEYNPAQTTMAGFDAPELFASVDGDFGTRLADNLQELDGARKDFKRALAEIDRDEKALRRAINIAFGEEVSIADAIARVDAGEADDTLTRIVNQMREGVVRRDAAQARYDDLRERVMRGRPAETPAVDAPDVVDDPAAAMRATGAASMFDAPEAGGLLPGMPEPERLTFGEEPSGLAGLGDAGPLLNPPQVVGEAGRIQNEMLNGQADMFGAADDAGVVIEPDDGLSPFDRLYNRGAQLRDDPAARLSEGEVNRRLLSDQVRELIDAGEDPVRVKSEFLDGATGGPGRDGRSYSATDRDVEDLYNFSFAPDELKAQYEAKPADFRAVVAAGKFVREGGDEELATVLVKNSRKAVDAGDNPISRSIDGMTYENGVIDGAEVARALNLDRDGQRGLASYIDEGAEPRRRSVMDRISRIAMSERMLRGELEASEAIRRDIARLEGNGGTLSSGESRRLREQQRLIQERDGNLAAFTEELGNEKALLLRDIDLHQRGEDEILLHAGVNLPMAGRQVAQLVSDLYGTGTRIGRRIAEANAAEAVQAADAAMALGQAERTVARQTAGAGSGTLGPIIPDEVAALRATTFERNDAYLGRSYGEVIDEFHQQAIGDRMELAGLRAAPQDEATRTRIASIKRRWENFGDIENATDTDLLDMAVLKIEEPLRVEKGVKEAGKFARAYQRTLTYGRVMTLLAPWRLTRYLLSNELGNATQVLLKEGLEGGSQILKTSWGLRHRKALYDYAVRGGDPLNSSVGDIVRGMGLGGYNPQLVGGSLIDAQLNRQRKALRRAAGSARSNWVGSIADSAPGRAVGAYTDWARNVANATEYSGRTATWAHHIRTLNVQAKDRFGEEMADLAGRQNITATDISAAFRLMPEYVDGATVGDRMERLALARGATADEAAGFGREMGRQWANRVFSADKEAVDRTNKALFSYRQTNADKALANVFMFHYWQSRAYPFYFEQMIRHPGFGMAYMRATEDLDSHAEAEGYPASMKGFVKWSQGPGGMVTLADPLSVIGMLDIFVMDNGGYNDENLTGLGKLVNSTSQAGFGLTAPIAAALNYAGYLSDSPVGLDPLSTYAARKNLGSLVQLGQSMGILSSDAGVYVDQPFQSMLERLRQATSGKLPGSRPVYAGDPAATPKTQIGYILLNDILAEYEMDYGTFTRLAMEAEQNPISGEARQVDEIMTEWMDEQAAQGPRYARATEQYARSNAMFETIKAGAPGLWRQSQDGQMFMQAMSQGPSAGGPRLPGFGPMPKVDPYAEPAVLANTKAFTTKWTETFGLGYRTGDIEKAVSAAGNVKELMQATPEAAPILVAAQQRAALGTSEEKAMLGRYYDIANAEGGGVSVAGYTFTQEQLAALDYDQRWDLADQWLAERGNLGQRVADLRAMQQVFDESNPEFAAFDQWKSGTRKQWGGNAAAFREATARISPNYKRWLDDQTRRLRGEGLGPNDIQKRLDAITFSLDSYLAYRGIQKMKFDPKPLGTADPLPVASAGASANAFGGSGSGGSGSYGDSIRTSVEEGFAFTQKVNGWLAQSGFGSDVDITQMPRDMRDRLMAQMGEDIPRDYGSYLAYVDWAREQMRLGMNGSLDAYVAWKLAEEPAGAFDAAADPTFKAQQMAPAYWGN